VQPGFPEISAWLHKIILGYQYYKFTHLEFQYVPSCTTATSGMVQFGVSIDVTDPNPANSTQMSQQQPYCECSAWTGMSCVVPQAFLNRRNRGEYLVRGGAIANASDTKNYDCCNFFVATEGNPDDGTVIGKIWIRYRVLLMNASIYPEPFAALLTATVAATTPFNSAQAVGNSSDNRVQFVPGSTNQIQILEPGTFIITWDLGGVTALATMAVVATGSDSVLVANFTVIGTGFTSGAGNYRVNIPFYDRDDPCILTFSMTGSSGVGTSKVRVSPYTTVIS
jgi:hypothetical protein